MAALYDEFENNRERTTITTTITKKKTENNDYKNTITFGKRNCYDFRGEVNYEYSRTSIKNFLLRFIPQTSESLGKQGN